MALFRMAAKRKPRSSCHTCYEYTDGSNLQLRFVMTDPAGNVLDQGNVDAHYADGRFYLKMGDRTVSPDIVKYLSIENELMGDFLDYPNTMGDDFDPLDFNPVFAMDGGDFTIRSKSDKRDFVRVHNHDREYVGTENITTPAGSFQASKITYEVDVTCEGKTHTYRGVEWYAPGAGIVRSEIYDGSSLQNYTVLTSLAK